MPNSKTVWILNKNAAQRLARIAQAPTINVVFVAVPVMGLGQLLLVRYDCLLRHNAIDLAVI